MKCSVVIPLFNEEENLRPLHSRLHSVLESLSSPYEIIFVDDGSTDTSPEILKKLSQNHPAVRFISFRVNKGQSTALYAGFRASRGEWIITLDADLQNPPEEIPKLWELRNEADFITGIREKRRDTLLRKISSRIAKYFRSFTLGDTTQDTGCSLRMFKSEVVENLPYFRNFHRFFTFLAREAGFRVREVPLEHNERRFGTSKYTTLGRAKEGIFDLIGVFWLKRRLINYEIKGKTDNV
jgi:glycosyltransferase involved in cell wall biosynthesis